MRFKIQRRLPALKQTFSRGFACLCLLIAQAFSVLFLATMGGFITGVVRERSGAVMPDVEVRIQDESTGAQQTVSSDENGKFVSAELAPGSYRVVLRRRGFRTASYPGLTVQPSQTRSGDFVIQLLPLEQEITVEALATTRILPRMALQLSAARPTALSRQTAAICTPITASCREPY